MRFIGNKENLLNYIHNVFERFDISGERFFDFFAGTTNVGRYFKSLGYSVESSDILFLSYCLQKAYIENNTPPDFSKLLPHIDTAPGLFNSPLDIVVNHLNSTDNVYGFISRNYTPLGTQDLPQPRMYFSEENGLRIDAVRTEIERWNKLGLLSENEYYVLLSCLIESVSFYANVSGVYAAFQKKWDPRAIKRFTLRPIKFYNNRKCNKVHNTDSMKLVEKIDTDILYLDPPYNERQYLPNYHIIETIARYDTPEIKGVTGMRPYANEKSTFCNAKTALRDLEHIAATARYRHLVLSYNSEGIMPTESIISTLSRYGKLNLEETPYARFKSNSKGSLSAKRHIQEQLFILSK